MEENRNTVLAERLFGWSRERQRIAGVERDIWETGVANVREVPDWGATWEGAGRVIHAMHNKGWTFALTPGDDNDSFVIFKQGRRYGKAWTEVSIQRAVEDAAYQALTENLYVKYPDESDGTHGLGVVVLTLLAAIFGIIVIKLFS